MSTRPPITAIIVGAGHRAVGMARHAERYPDEMTIVAERFLRG
jgi:hypothetical protein